MQTETILLEGDFLEFKNKPRPSNDANLPSNPIINTEKATELINAFLYAGGEIENASCRFSHHLENYMLWLKEYFECFEIDCTVKLLSAGRPGRPAVWLFETSPYVELGQFERKWYYSNHRRKMTEFNKTAAVIFFFYLNNGVFYKFKGHNCISLCMPPDFIGALRAIGIDVSKYRSGRMDMKETDIEKFFTCICEHWLTIPSCFHDKFPPEYIRYNETWALMEKLNSLTKKPE